MAHASIWFTTKEEAQETMAAFAEIAKRHGYTNERGPSAGEGNVREMMEAIIRGEMATVLLGDEERDAAIDELRRLADECELYAGQVAFRDIADALDEARSREWEWYEKEMRQMDVIDSWDIDETTSFDIVETEAGPVARITYNTTGLQFTTADWQGKQPESPDEITDFDWVCTDGRPAIMMDGLPVILE